MKKNLMSVLILLLCLANFVMCALMLFSQMSNTKKVNNLIDKISTAISLEQNSGTATGASNVPIDEQVVYQVKGGDTMLANLTSDGSGDYAVSFSCSLSLNTNSDNYEKFSPEVLQERDDIIASTIMQIVSKYTVTEINQNQDAVRAEILEEMQDLFGKDYVIDVNFPSIITTAL